MASKKRRRGPKKGKRAAKSKRNSKKRHLSAAHKRKLMAGLRKYRAAVKAGKRRGPRRRRAKR